MKIWTKAKANDSTSKKQKMRGTLSRHDGSVNNERGGGRRSAQESALEFVLAMAFFMD